MLQQKQTERVIEKYCAFIKRFHNIASLAQASFLDVLQEWKGLGYNRRAKWIHEIAKKVNNEYDGVIPKGIEELEKFPGIGKTTARSIAAFAFNIPTVFLETNIRTVLIYRFFQNKSNIEEKRLYDIASQVMDREDPRE